MKPFYGWDKDESEYEVDTVRLSSCRHLPFVSEVGSAPFQASVPPLPVLANWTRFNELLKAAQTKFFREKTYLPNIF
jgi:hypothetical protein